MFRILGHITRN